VATRRRYYKGRRYEYKARKLLEQEGFEVVRSAASKGKWDLVAVKPGCVRLIQVKKGKPTESAIKKFLPLLADIAVVFREVWFYQEGKGFTIVKNDGQDWTKVVKEIREVSESGRSRKDNR